MFERSRETTESVLEKTLFASRWLLAPFYLGLAISIAILLIKFVQELSTWRRGRSSPARPIPSSAC